MAELKKDGRKGFAGGPQDIELRKTKTKTTAKKTGGKKFDNPLGAKTTKDKSNPKAIGNIRAKTAAKKNPKAIPNTNDLKTPKRKK